MSKDRETTKLEDIPPEILQKIFIELKVLDYIRCSYTSKRFREICRDESTWQKMLSKMKVCL